MITDDQIITETVKRARMEDWEPSASWLRKQYGIGYGRAKRLRDKARAILDAENADGPLIEFEERDNTATLSAVISDRIITAEQLIETAGVDMRIWTPERQRVKKWDVVTKDASGNPVITQAFGISVSFKRNRTGESLVKLFDEVLDDIRAHAPEYPKLSQHIPNQRDYLFVVSIPDAHFGKLAWSAETGENYDVKIAQAIYDASLDNVLSFAHDIKPKRILYVVGNDLLHVDNGQNTTTAGTVQDVDGRWQKAFRSAFQSVVRGVEKMRTFCDVDVAVIPGNHDRERAWLLGEGLAAWFRNDNGVRVLNEPSPRRYYAIGRVLIGLTHGDGEKVRDLPAIMADETGEQWTRARRREWLIGHFHRRKHHATMPLADERGVMVRVLPSLTAADAWHVRKGYHGQRAAVGIAYSLDGLEVRDYTVALPEDERREVGVFVVSGDA